MNKNKGNNVEEMKVLVNSAYDCLTSLSTNLSNAGLVPGGLYHWAIYRL